VDSIVAGCTKGDEILSRIISELASLLGVMNLEFCALTAVLASPTIASQHVLT
jgi:hypothetical protein